MAKKSLVIRIQLTIRWCSLCLMLQAPILMTSCYRDHQLDQEMEAMYQRSKKLRNGPQDSINVFTYQLKDYLVIHPEAARHPRFLPILENLYKEEGKPTRYNP